MYDQDIIELMSEMLTKLQLPFDGVDVSEDGEIIRVDVKSAKPSAIIGWHGETLNSLQHLLKSLLRSRHDLKRAPFIVCDTDGYRLGQERKVCGIAEQKADFVRRTGSRVALPAMSPYFRRIVHTHVVTSEHLQDLTTDSAGEGDHRHIVLRLKDEKAVAQTDSNDGELAPVIDDGDDLGSLDV